MKKDLQIFGEFVYGVQTEDDLGRVFDDRNRSLNDPRITRKTSRLVMYTEIIWDVFLTSRYVENIFRVPHALCTFFYALFTQVIFFRDSANIKVA